MKVCGIEECGRTDGPMTRGWCELHYGRWKAHGDPTFTMTPTRGMSANERFDFYVRRSSGCWEWAGKHRPDGYAILAADGEQIRAHRFSYERFVGPIPHGKEIDHLCRNRGCVKPSHLEAVTRQVNMLRGDTVAAKNAAKTHCANGHPYNARNTYIRKDHYSRQCRICDAERQALRRKRSA